MPNRLIDQTSPYLLQHADNPVDWFPWGEEALALAREADRPILLSIGYSACHWCHVMAHECFEDGTVAAAMNAGFVNVKVDREERPDLDQIYQAAHQMLTGRQGGWPLTLFLTPDGTPFYGGTYFPKTARYGLPAFPDLLERVDTVFRARRDEIEAQNASLRAALTRNLLPERGDGQPADDLNRNPMAALFGQLEAAFDPVNGGFGGAPKFPHPTDLAFLLRWYLDQGDMRARDMFLTTLDRMASGGIYDHLGGGFCRYSVDEHWMIPHLEKMLYDNAQLLRLYAEAFALTAEPRYREVAEETAAWILRDMAISPGGYASSLDADSQGEEGTFYLWTPDAVRAVLSESEYPVLARRFGLDRAPNFEGRDWHLYAARDVADVAADFDIDAAECERLLRRSRAKLLASRSRRAPPARDDKLLTGWTALTIDSLVRAGALLGHPEWIASARRALEAIRITLWADGRLLATSKDGHAHLNAYLDDYAFLLAAVLELIQADFRPGDLDWAHEIADVMLDRFEDAEHGGFHFTSHDHETLIARPRSAHDNATPSGNSIAALALQRLGHLVGEPRYLRAAERSVRSGFHLALNSPGGLASYMAALEEFLEPPTIVILRGPREEVEAWRAGLAGRTGPAVLVVPLADVTGDLPVSLDRPLLPDVNAWVCSGVTCLPPISDWAELERVCKPRHIG
jgi:uncharacterized protein YyaL (SSP411 family)